MKDFLYISGDSHYQPPPDTWAHRMPEQFRAHLPKRVKLPNGGDGLQSEDGRITYGGTGQFPPRHYHPSQDEHFEVLEGTVRTIVDGEERSHEAGEMFDISAGTVHQLAADPPARLKWEVRPALRTAEFFETVYSGEIPPDLRERFSDEVVFLL